MNITKKMLLTATALASVLILLFTLASAPVPSSPAPIEPTLPPETMEESPDEGKAPELQELRILGALLLVRS